MATMHEIEVKTKTYADARTELATYVQALEDEIRAVKRRYLQGIKRRVATAKAAREELRELIGENQALFVKPRTALFHGIRVGFEKGKGVIEIADVARFVERVREHLRAKFDVLVKTTYKPVKKAIANLPADDLKKLGVKVTGTSDEVVIHDATGEVDKLVEALLQDEPEEVDA